MNALILRNENREVINTKLLGLTGLNLYVPSPSFRLHSEEIDGRGGRLILDRVLNTRTLVADFYYTSPISRIVDVRDILFEIFSSKYFFISDKKTPGKQWRVISEPWTPEDFSEEFSSFEVSLTAIDGVQESVNVVARTYSDTSFGFHNDGSVPIDMRTQEETEITFTGASSGLAIHNLTTGDTWTYYGTTTVDDVITLKGVLSLINGQSIFGQTNKRLISFAVGNNEFKVSGASGDFELTISTRFYFL